MMRSRPNWRPSPRLLMTNSRRRLDRIYPPKRLRSDVWPRPHVARAAKPKREGDSEYELAGALGVEQTYSHTRVGVYLGEPGVEHPDPYFDVDGPPRSGCLRCGECMVGCRHGAKNTLVKNYLWFAERLGVRIDAERTVTDVRPLGAPDGSEGYAVTHVPSGALRRGRGERITARGVVLAAGALGTNRLLANCRHRGSLPRVSERLGHLVRTNSESIVAG